MVSEAEPTSERTQGGPQVAGDRWPSYCVAGCSVDKEHYDGKSLCLSHPMFLQHVCNTYPSQPLFLLSHFFFFRPIL
uniref:Uncharacterized protein n=1 Tax=Nelumbo nucifera TaxID=4432 RepID=A0A822ZLG8_NELNU|nr:TPA_asm: hypothetical protein HUJ06_004272 [Nelumbo nucifera]